jgi:general secretion pathway protein H
LPAERCSRISGFTLLELLVVLTILGVAVAMTMPLFGKRGSGAELRAKAGEIRVALRKARAIAIAEGRPVTFRTAVGGYWVDRQYHRLAAANSGSALRLDSTGQGRIAFFPSGGSSGGRVVLRGADGRRQIDVDAVTGRAVPAP